MANESNNPGNFEMFEYIPLGVFVLRSDFVVLFWNSLIEEWTGINRNSIVGAKILDHFPNLGSRKYLDRLNTIFSGGPPIVFSSQLHKHIIPSPLSNNRFRIQHTTVVALLSSGEDFHALFAIQDVTDMTERIHSYRRLHEHALLEIDERKKAEDALQREKERLAVTLRSIGDGVIATDTSGRVVLMNYIAENLTGWSQEEAFGRSLNEIFHVINKKSRLPCENPLDTVIKGGGVTHIDRDIVLLARNGGERIISESVAAIRDNEGNIFGVVFVFHDITEKERMEEELFRSQKIASIGVLAAGIAHDFNNLLTVILGNISLAKALSPPQEKVHSRLTEAEKASLRAKDLTGQFITFAKGGAPVKRTIDIAELVKATADFALSGSRVSCELSAPADLWPVEADEVQLRQAIVNLIINAEEAMPEGGSVRITLENVTLGPGAVPPLIGGRYCRLSISDQGVGIPQEHLAKIFEPYFTTKENAKGLGLFTAYSIIQRHDGHISVESVEGEGTIFSIFLPTEGGEICTDAYEISETPSPGDRILVMDDEEVIREVAGEILNHLGFEVEFAKGGADAVELFTRNWESGRPFAAVILDLTIPGGMGGKEAVSRMLEVDPSLKAIVASGYTNDTILSDYRAYGFSGCISKPYTFNDLATVMRDTLGLKNISLRISKIKE